MTLLSLAKFSKLEGTRDDDWADRASHLYTVLLLCIFAALVSSAQYVGDPIHCWCPAEFPSFHVAYTKNLCWVKNTYYIPMQDGIPKEIHKRDEGEITYYQWVPIIFLSWRCCSKRPTSSGEWGTGPAASTWRSWFGWRRTLSCWATRQIATRR
ncbi:hypothetical protein BaRGS_00010151 [Batillaria attramentaria]|uniref:Innexin n=1 Tax=Batillaria attramentaria TaxID=370345 RepID=A0ABD0LG60_9CAEN